MTLIRRHGRSAPAERADPTSQNDEPSPTGTKPASRPRTESKDPPAADDTALPLETYALPSLVHVSTYHVAKWMILRLLGVVYLVAFLGAWYQNEGLFGEHGLVPASMQVYQDRYNSKLDGFLHHPTLFWWIPFNDETMRALMFAGLVLSALVVAGLDSWLVQAALWMLDFSIVTIAQSNSFYAYGWESQLLETGFLAIFLCAVPDASGWHWMERRHDTTTTEPSPIVLWLFRWLCFRISLGAGLIKIRGSSCWTDKTCLHYHFETQPIPSPLSFVYHFLPPSIQSAMVDVDLVVQLYTSALVLIPLEWTPSRWYGMARGILRWSGVMQAGFMIGILLSGNFAFLNHLTIVPALACFDDDFVPAWLRTMVAARPKPCQAWRQSSRRYVDGLLLLLVAFLSWPVLANLLQRAGSRQIMNASFDPFRIVNTYGAFGSVGQARYEAIVAVSEDGTRWYELELPCKPGRVDRRPCFCAPYHYRLDWNIWFLGFKPHQRMLRQREAWLYSLVAKLLQSDLKYRPWLDLLDPSTADYLRQTYFNDHNKAPAMVKVDMYHYRMSKPLWELSSDWWRGRQVIWWHRQMEENLIPPVEWEFEQQRLRIAGS